MYEMPIEVRPKIKKDIYLSSIRFQFNLNIKTKLSTKCYYKNSIKTNETRKINYSSSFHFYKIL